MAKDPKKIANTNAGISIWYNDEYHPCSSITGCLFLGNDDHTTAYCLVGAKLPNTRIKLENGTETTSNEEEYHLIDEFSEKLSDDMVLKLKKFLTDLRVERVIIVCSDESLRVKVRKSLDIKCVFQDEKKRNNYSIILREWFARKKPIGGTPVLKLWSDCREAIKSNYLPARDCTVRLLEWFDSRNKKVKALPIQRRTHSTGYG